MNTRSGDWHTLALIPALACASPALQAAITEIPLETRGWPLTTVTAADAFGAVEDPGPGLSLHVSRALPREAQALVSLPEPAAPARTLHSVTLIPDLPRQSVSLRPRAESSEPELPVPLPAPLALFASAFAMVVVRRRR
ncbi:MAG: hypothetical protein AB7O21_19400 [Gammaproteobacteria bacterium]